MWVEVWLLSIDRYDKMDQLVDEMQWILGVGWCDRGQGLRLKDRR